MAPAGRETITYMVDDVAHTTFKQRRETNSVVMGLGGGTRAGSRRDSTRLAGEVVEKGLQCDMIGGLGALERLDRLCQGWSR